MNHSYSTTQDTSVGCGLLGCLGGLVMGVTGGVALLLLAALVMALTAPAPTLATSPPGPDLQVTVEENFLNRFVEQPPEGAVQVDILPNNQVQVRVDTTVSALGVVAPVQITGLFEILALDQTLQVRLLDTQLSGLPLPADAFDFFGPDIAVVNQDLDQAMTEISNVLGTPVILNRLITTETQLRLEIQEAE